MEKLNSSMLHARPNPLTGMSAVRPHHAHIGHAEHLEHDRSHKEAHAELMELYKEFLEAHEEFMHDKSPEAKKELNHVEAEIRHFFATHKAEHFGKFKHVWERLSALYAEYHKTKNPKVKDSINAFEREMKEMAGAGMSKFEGEDQDYYSAANAVANNPQPMQPVHKKNHTKAIVIGLSIVAVGVLAYVAHKKKWFHKKG